jgi:hypothetical protein
LTLHLAFWWNLHGLCASEDHPTGSPAHKQTRSRLIAPKWGRHNGSRADQELTRLELLPIRITPIISPNPKYN